jgi:hypothetical protein
VNKAHNVMTVSFGKQKINLAKMIRWKVLISAGPFRFEYGMLDSNYNLLLI